MINKVGKLIEQIIHYINPTDVLSGKISSDQLDMSLLSHIRFVDMTNWNEKSQERMIAAIFDWVQEEIEENICIKSISLNEEKSGNLSFWELLSCFVNKILRGVSGRVVYRFKYLRDWQFVSAHLGTDLFMALKFCMDDTSGNDNQYRREHFSWKMIPDSDNYRINTLLQKGVSDNHFHLWASAPYFELSWISMMNDFCHTDLSYLSQKIEKNNLDFRRRINHIEREEAYYYLILKAACIRLYLYILTSEVSDELLSKDRVKLLFDNIELMISSQQNVLLWIHQAQSVVYALRLSREGRLKDYILSEKQIIVEEMFRSVFSGERWLYYRLFVMRRQKSKEWGRSVFDKLFAYILIKQRIRQQLVYINEYSGFENFQFFEKRKGIFAYGFSKEEFAQIAVRNAFYLSNMKKLELRIVPGNSVGEDIQQIVELDKAILLAWKKKHIGDYYYVLHFKKEKESTFNDYYRHYSFRNKIRRKAKAIIDMRERIPDLAERICGIDACSSEDGCRPEVFGPIFRMLKHHQIRIKTGVGQRPNLRASYHVGEDNQDVLDGIRAISEAVLFLNLESGDRLGHATMLGIDCEDWYERHDYACPIRRQDCLDNVMWLYEKIVSYHIENTNNLLEYLEKEFRYYFDAIFSKSIMCSIPRIDVCDIDIHKYYCSWLLRGDDPELYKDGKRGRINYFKNIWDVEKSNHYIEEKRRADNIASYLNYLYYFDKDVRVSGSKIEVMPITKDMVRAIVRVQKKMRFDIAKKGIAIETNPTSNVLISGIQEYVRHPIVNFYNKKLTINMEEIKDCAQISTSINTDDAGVFTTSVNNEYALMAYTLENKKDIDGNPVYTIDSIYDWLNQIRKMGNEQSFQRILFETKEERKKRIKRQVEAIEQFGGLNEE